MNVKFLKSALFALVILFSAFYASAARVSESDVKKCYMVELKGSQSTDVIKITALPGESKSTKGMAFVTLPGGKEYTVRGFKYIVSGGAEGCFGVVENLYYNGRTYNVVSLMVALEVDQRGFVNVIYTISDGENTFVEKTFTFSQVKYTDLNRNSYIDNEWSTGFLSFECWLKSHIEEYEE